MSGMLSEKMSDMSETVSGVSDSFWTGPRVDIVGSGAARVSPDFCVATQRVSLPIWNIFFLIVGRRGRM